MARDQGDHPRARVLYEHSLGLAAELGDRRCQAAVLGNLARLADRERDGQRAATLWNRSLLLQRDLGDQRGIARAVESLGQLAPQL